MDSECPYGGCLAHCEICLTHHFLLIDLVHVTSLPPPPPPYCAEKKERKKNDSAQKAALVNHTPRECVPHACAQVCLCILDNDSRKVDTGMALICS